MNDLHQQLDQATARVRELRQERAEARMDLDTATAAAKASGDHSGTKALTENLQKASIALQRAEAEEKALLGQVADAEQGLSGEAASRVGVGTGSGWAAVASQINVQRGELRADIPLASVLAAPGQTPPTNGRPTAQPAPSNRWLFPVLPSEDFPTSAGNEPEFVANDYVVSFGQDPVSGIDRDVDATSEKAVLPVNVNLATVNARQFALVVENLPSKVLSARRALQDFLSREVGRRLNGHFDQHVVEAVESGSPPAFNATGDLVADVRRALSEMQDRGGVPRYLALDPATAADLDLSVQPGTGDYVFRVDLEGSGSPVWTLSVRVVPSIAAPTLVDPSAFIVFLGNATLLFDPYSGLSTNLVRVRVEYEAAAHRRSLETGVTVIS